MTDNTEVVSGGAEIYAHRLFELADAYMKQFGSDEKEAEKKFREMIFYVADRIKAPDHDDIGGLNNLFDAYVRLCVHFNRLPTLEAFSWLTKIHRSTFDDWKNGRYRTSDSRYADTVKNWLGMCKSFVIDELTNNRTANVNLIFVAKACHHIRENEPIPHETNRLKDTPSPIEIIAKYSGDYPELEDIEMPED